MQAQANRVIKRKATRGLRHKHLFIPGKQAIPQAAITGVIVAREVLCVLAVAVARMPAHPGQKCLLWRGLVLAVTQWTERITLFRTMIAVGSQNASAVIANAVLQKIGPLYGLTQQGSTSGV